MSSIVVNESNSTIAVGANADTTISGDDDILQIGANSLVYATGMALTAEIAGPGAALTIGGDGQYADDSCEDIALFQAGGTLNVLANSRVDANASNVTATLAGDDTFGIYGANDTVNANGAHDALWIGQNGLSGGVDIVNGLTGGTLFALQGSNVAIAGSQIAATLTGDDKLNLSGSSVTVSASNLGDIVNIAGASYSDDDVVSFTCGGVVNASNVQHLEVFGDNVVLRGPNIFSSELIGAGDRAVLSNFYNNFTIGGNGVAGALDVVVAPYENLAPVIDVVANSNVRIVGGGSQVVAQGGDRVVVIGHLEEISDTTGGNVFIVDGQNNVAEPNLFNTAVLTTGDIMRMRADTSYSVNVSANTAPDTATVVMGADDALSVGPDVRVRVPTASGQSSLVFGAFDTVVLLTPFASAADVLAHTTDNANGSIIQFDSAGDQLQVNVSKSQVGNYLAQGVIKFA